MLPKIIPNIYCHICGKICSSNIKEMELQRAEEWIKDWLKCPHCIDCIKSKNK